MNRISQEEIVVDHIKKNLVQIKSVKGDMVYTRDDYATHIHHFETLIKELKYNEIYNISSFGADINGFKNITFDQLRLNSASSTQQVSNTEVFRFNIKEFMEEEFKEINNIISILSKGSFSSGLVSAIVKSVLVYQFMQSSVLTVLQKNFEPSLAEEFIEQTKSSIKSVVELLQKNRLI
jgi:hypothetical protein